jgi:hypothetical protein
VPSLAGQRYRIQQIPKRQPNAFYGKAATPERAILDDFCFQNKNA